MYRKLLLGLFTATLLIADVSAQSAERNDRKPTAAERKQERLDASEIQKIANKIEKTNFAGIKLETKQRRALKQLVKDKYDSLSMVEQKMQRLIPEDKAKDLRRKYSAALRKGSTETEAMLLSMQDVGFDESLQKQIMTLGAESDVVVKEIATELSGQLNAEQKEVFMALAKEKDATAGNKEAEGGEAADAKLENEEAKAESEKDNKTDEGDVDESESDENKVDENEVEVDGSGSK